MANKMGSAGAKPRAIRTFSGRERAASGGIDLLRRRGDAPHGGRGSWSGVGRRQYATIDTFFAKKRHCLGTKLCEQFVYDGWLRADWARMRLPRRALPGLGLAAAVALARGPLHAATHALPVSNDDAIPLLIARHILRGELATILWNQPYNGTLDAYLLAPGLLLGSAHTVFRAYEAACGVLLVAVVGWLARGVAGEAAGWSAAFLAAVG